MITGQTLRDAILSGANKIANQRTRVDELNVFPCPDGDTGTNKSMTIGAARAELEAMPDSCTVAEASKTAASAMLRGARGNSGVITSRFLFRGFSKALKDKTEASAADLAAAAAAGCRGRLQGRHEAHRGHHSDCLPVWQPRRPPNAPAWRSPPCGTPPCRPVRLRWTIPPTCCPC